MASITQDAHNQNIIIGVDTHKYVHVAVALDNLGARLGERHVRANRESYNDNFNGNLRNELLDGDIFYSLKERGAWSNNGDSTTTRNGRTLR